MFQFLVVYGFVDICTGILWFSVF